MKKQLLICFGLTAMCLSVSNCAAVVAGGATGVAAATDPRGFSGVVDDQTLEHNVNVVLGKQAPEGSYTVASFNGHVLLAGQVPSAEYRAKAELAVKNTVGVKSVHNYLTISKNESLSDISNDTYLTSAAKTRLIGQKGVNTNNIKVVTCAGTVYLLGKDAGVPEQLNAAVIGIKQIDGVRNVVDLIQSNSKK